MIVKAKNTVPWTYVIGNLNGKEILGTFYEKRIAKKQIKKSLELKIIQRKENKLYVKWKCYNSYFNSWTDKKYIMYFTRAKPLETNVKVEIDLSNYATKSDFKMPEVFKHQRLLKRLI